MKLRILLINILFSSTMAVADVQPLEPLDSDIHPTKLVWDMGNAFLSNMVQIDEKNLTTGSTQKRPWSGDYLSSANGGAAFRYADPILQSIIRNSGKARSELKKVKDYSQTHPVMNYVANGKINQLSPSEKYDLLIGDSNQTLTKRMLEDSKNVKDLDFWQGHCDGWAAASMFEKRPINAVTVTAVGGEKITFYPDDLKALMTLFWAEIDYDYTLIGPECGSRRRAGTQAEGGCYQKLNSAAWHLMVVNQIGQNKVPLVFDESFGYEEWNFPLHSYKFRYYNLINGKEYSNLKSDENKDGLPDALIKRTSLRDNRYKYRAKDSKYLVGVIMDIQYANLKDSTVQQKDSVSADKTKQMTLYYDLEISSDYEIVGGEWDDDNHPDFAWTFPQGTKAELPIEKTLGLKWDGTSPISQASQVAARGGEVDGVAIPSQSQKLLPLPHIFKTLVELSQ